MRVAENLNTALHAIFENDPAVYLLGADIADPYGGAFKITKGLSSRFPGRVLATPLSEGGIAGVAAGLALSGSSAIVEIMFGDFATLAFDQIANFASKSVSMYGRRLPLPLLVRCPSGAGRGYGPTHSQSLQKHFIGIPGLSLYEISPFHDNHQLVPAILARAQPALLFEDKILYTRSMFTDGVVDDVFSYDFVHQDIARVFVEDPDTYDCAVIVPGGLAHRAISAARTLFLEQEISCQILVPSRLFPFDVEPLLPLLAKARAICVAEDSTAGGTWGAEIAHLLHCRLWGELRRPVTLVHSADTIIPTALHLENQILVKESTITQAIGEALRD